MIKALDLSKLCIRHHWLHIFGKTWHHRLYCLDFCGIGLSIHAAHLSWIYYGLYAGPSLFKIYAPIQVVILIWTLIISYQICYSKMNVDSSNYAFICFGDKYLRKMSYQLHASYHIIFKLVRIIMIFI